MDVNSKTKNKTPTIMEPIVSGVISITPRGEIGSVETSINVEAEVELIFWRED